MTGEVIELPDRGRRRQRRPAAVRAAVAEQGRPVGAGGLADPGRRRPARRRRAAPALRSAHRRRSTRPTPRWCAGWTPACRCWSASGRRARWSAAGSRTRPAAPRSGDRARPGLRPAAPLDAGDRARRGLGGTRATRPTRCSTSGEVTLRPPTTSASSSRWPRRSVPRPRCGSSSSTPTASVRRRTPRSVRAPGTSPGSAARRRPRVRAADVPAGGGRAGAVARRSPTADRSTCSRSPRRRSRWATTCTCAPRPRPTCCCGTCCPPWWAPATLGAGEVARFLSANHLLFLTLAMASAER